MTIPKTTIPFVFNYQAVEVELQRQCDFLFKQRMGMEVTLSLRFDVPQNLETLIQQNRTLKANITLAWPGSGKPINIEFPAPYHGVFIIRSDKDMIATKRCWIPILADKQGEWILKKYKDKSIDLVIRKVFPGGRYLEYPIDTGEELKTKKKIPTVIQIDNEGIEFAFNQEKTALRKLFLKNASMLDGKNPDSFDDQDLYHQRLLTFTNYIVERFIEGLINNLHKVFKDNNRYLEIIRSSNPKITIDETNSLWQDLFDNSRYFGWRLVPVDYLISNGRLELFSPLNNIDAVSQLTSLKRYPYSKNLPAIYHQNHSSFKNIFCPIETPESADIGITVHLTKGVTTDIWGNLYVGEKNEKYIGHAASLVPFYQHNDAVRVMMGAKNLRQAVPISGAEPPMITSGNEINIINEVKPLTIKRLVPEEFMEFKPGRNLLVAYMPWFGYNFEDAIVASSDLITSGHMDWISEQHYSQYILPGYIPDLNNGIKKIGCNISNNDTLAEFPETEGDNGLPVLYEGVDGILSDLQYFDPGSKFIGGVLRWTVKYRIPLQVGSKLMARYGNKGVISKYYTPDQMPRLPDDENLPSHLRGKSVDLVLNPHGVISRMNLGQLLETQYSLAMSMGFKAPPNIGTAFEQLDHSKLSNFFESKPPFDKYGRIEMQFEDGSFTNSPVTIGYEYFTVLKHIPSKKAHVRRGRDNSDRYNQITGQPVGGKANKGGQRIGEMEFWALAGHQANHIIHEILTHRSDVGIDSDNLYAQTTQAIHDHLFALGFKFDKYGKVSAVSGSDIHNISKPIENNKTRIPAIQGSFCCKKCDYKLFGGENIISAAVAQRSPLPIIDIKFLLKHFGYEIKHIPDIEFQKPKVGAGKIVKEFKIETNKGDLHFRLDLKRSGVKLFFKINGEELIADRRIGDVFNLSKLPSLSIQCKKHTSEMLICNDAKYLALPIPGGLYDEKIFGNTSIIDPILGWGSFVLPFELQHPMFKNNMLKVIPILPIKYRSTSTSVFLARWEEHEITSAYSRIIINCLKYGKTNDSEKRDELRKSTKNWVKSLYKKIRNRTFGKKGKSKFGLLRRHGLGRRVDYSGRLVIVPGPSLGWDEVSVPVNVLSVLYGDKISETVEDESLKNFFLNFRDINHHIHDEDAALDAINNFLSNSNSRVLLNRAPSLHKYNILSFKPIPHQIKDGMVLKLNPIVFKGFGADADGDEMSIHALMDEESIVEAVKLSPIHKSNILSLASGEPILDFDQDFVLGNFLLNEETKSEGISRVKQLIKKEKDYHEIILSEMRASFDEVTRDGVSFSFLELLKCKFSKKEIEILMSANSDNINSELEDAVKIKLEEIVSDKSNPGYYFAAMAFSGARGKKQIRQVLAARGLLSPGLVGFEADDNQFKIPESLVDGMTPESSYISTFNARSSMIDKNIGTFKAGYFMRKLVLALWPWRIEKGNCGSRSNKNCEFIPKRKLCSSCYESNVHDNYPAGLIAAQSIGETCTQLTMSSFHSGEKGITLSDVESILSDVPNNFSKFYKDLKEISAFEYISEKHFYILWLAIIASPKSTLNSAIKYDQSPLSLVAGIDGLGMISKFILENNEGDNFDHPIKELIQSDWIG